MPRKSRRTKATEQEQKRKEAGQRAWRATSNFNRMIPSLTGYSKSITGNPRIKIKPSAEGSYTDGSTIWLKPPLRLAENVPHDKILCGRRGPNLHQMCESCDVREMVMAGLYHEIAHITFGTMVEPSIEAILFAQEMIREWHPTDVCKHGAIIAAEMKRDSYLGLALSLHPIFKILVNTLEDARVNAAMFNARPGTRAMMDAHLHDVFENGVGLEDEEENKWQDRPTDQQVLIGLFLVASEYFGQVDLLSKEAQDVLYDDKLTNMLRSVGGAGDVHEVYLISAQIFRYLQTLGVMVVPKCEPTPPSPEGYDNEGDDSGTEKDSGSDCGGHQDPGASSRGKQGSPSVLGENPGDDERPVSGGAGEDAGNPKPDERGEGKGTRGSDGEDDTDGSDRDGEEDAAGSVGADDESADDDGGDSSDDNLPASDADAGGTDDDEDVSEDESDHDPEAERLEELIRAASRVSIHDLIARESPEADTKNFACGESHLTPADEGNQEEVPSDDMPGSDEADDSDEAVFGRALAAAIRQLAFFDTMSQEVGGMDVIDFPSTRHGWFRNTMHPELSDPKTYTPGEAVLGACTMEAQLAFEANRRSRSLGGLKSGRINPRALAKRAPVNDPHMFKKKIIPGKRDFHVVLGADVSGSTSSNNRITRIKRALFAQAEMLNRLGISFEVWCHSGGWSGSSYTEGMSGWMFAIKKADQAWDKEARVRLASINSSSGNLDGHTLEFYRKRADESNAQKKIICYYTDGAMPASNYVEELEILLREIDLCKKKDITLIAVGIETDSPVEYGFDTVQVDGDADLIKVVRQLKNHLTGS